LKSEEEFDGIRQNRNGRGHLPKLTHQSKIVENANAVGQKVSGFRQAADLPDLLELRPALPHAAILMNMAHTPSASRPGLFGD
jgi:hypothetical protein